MSVLSKQSIITYTAFGSHICKVLEKTNFECATREKKVLQFVKYVFFIKSVLKFEFQQQEFYQ